ncbi:putative tRNA-splicing endonuclease subunit Sen15 [Seiridium cardinale]|uniref:tRNA-splicing endonuclease subunit Sen15 n=1 Tax=Seiridium cardinale TaxID=138064 RepID=A0ABR2Y3C2_9PEZI
MEYQNHTNDLVAAVRENLENQQDWTSLEIHTHAPGSKKPHPRPLISGLAPRRIYIHPDDQIEMIKNNTMGGAAAQTPEVEWVLSTSLHETITLEFLSSIFDSMDRPANLPKGRAKRLLLAARHDDSTVVYYFVHDGIVKPRQN